MKTTKNTILITGGTSGIGRGLAEAFHDRGNRVIVTGRREALLKEVTAGRPGMVGLPLDLGDPASLPRLADEVRARFPELNVLVANAGISRTEDLTADDWNTSDAEAVVETNILGTLRVVAALLPLLKRQPDAAIMATSSNLAFIPPRGLPDLLCEQGVPALLAAIAAPPVAQGSRRGARTVPALRADRTDWRAPNIRPASDAARQICRRGHALAGDTRSSGGGEVLVEYDRGRRSAEREGRYDTAYAAINPT